jgi:hypothetical protein
LSEKRELSNGASKYNSRRHSEGEKYRSRRGSRVRTASLSLSAWAWAKASKTAVVWDQPQRASKYYKVIW